MSYISHDFDYMPRGSYCVRVGGQVEFLEDIPDELKARFLADLKRLREETAERNKRGIYSDIDYY